MSQTSSHRETSLKRTQLHPGRVRTEKLAKGPGQRGLGRSAACGVGPPGAPRLPPARLSCEARRKSCAVRWTPRARQTHSMTQGGHVLVGSSPPPLSSPPLPHRVAAPGNMPGSAPPQRSGPGEGHSENPQQRALQRSVGDATRPSAQSGLRGSPRLLDRKIIQKGTCVASPTSPGATAVLRRSQQGPREEDLCQPCLRRGEKPTANPRGHD